MKSLEKYIKKKESHEDFNLQLIILKTGTFQCATFSKQIFNFLIIITEGLNEKADPVGFYFVKINFAFFPDHLKNISKEKESDEDFNLQQIILKKGAFQCTTLYEQISKFQIIITQTYERKS